MTRPRWFALPWFVATLACFSACAGETSDTPSSQSGTSGAAGTSGQAGQGGAMTTPLPCEISEIIQQYCNDCHGENPKYGAPMSLLTVADFEKNTLDGSERIGDRAIERMKATTQAMPPKPYPTVPSDTVDKFSQWWAAHHETSATWDNCSGGQGGTSSGGAAGSSGSSQGGAGTGGSISTDCVPDLTVTAPEPYEMPETKGDQYICTGFEIPASGVKRHMTAFFPNIDNDKIVHHIILFEAPEAQSPTSVSCSGNIFPPSWTMLYGWAPGTPEAKLPIEAGFPIEADEDKHLVLQVHYSNLNHLAGEKDQSGVSLCTTEKLRENDAGILALGTYDINVAPHATWTTQCRLNMVNYSFLPLHVFQALPHMHQYGTINRTEVEHPDGSIEPMGVADPWDFYSQIAYPTNITLDQGDSVVTTCSWNNTSDSWLDYGEKTSDEMCFNFLSYYPRTGVWPTIAPLLYSDCN